MFIEDNTIDWPSIFSKLLSLGIGTTDSDQPTTSGERVSSTPQDEAVSGMRGSSEQFVSSSHRTAFEIVTNFTNRILKEGHGDPAVLSQEDWHNYLAALDYLYGGVK